MNTLRKITTLGIATLFSLILSLAVPLSVQADPPPWAPAHGYHKKHHPKTVYKYVYYPAQQVYYSPVRQGYYYPYQGGWRFNVNLPPTIRLGNSVSIDLGGPRPYYYHPTVIQQYPVVVVP